MGYKRLDVVPGDSNLWAYVCDGEADLANLPADALVALVLSPDEGKSQKRVKNSSGQWIEVK